jgi:hypothetical protein
MHARDIVYGSRPVDNKKKGQSPQVMQAFLDLPDMARLQDQWMKKQLDTLYGEYAKVHTCVYTFVNAISMLQHEQAGDIIDPMASDPGDSASEESEDSGSEPPFAWEPSEPC